MDDAVQYRILVIDDDEPLLRSLKLNLSLDGFYVDTARDGLEGLEIAASSHYDLIVLDLQMPRMDGRMFFRTIRARDDSTPVLILSAHGSDAARRELEAEGALSKPFEPEFLTETIRSLLNASSEIGGSDFTV